MESPIRSILNIEGRVRTWLNVAGGYVSLLMLRLLLGYEYLDSGLAKLGGTNWFARIDFPFPFSLLSADANWFLATWFEIAGAVLLIVGFATRYVSMCLIVVTLVAIHAAHLPTDGFGSISDLLDGYRISRQCEDGVCTGNYKLPVIFLVMFIPLAFSGGGKLSADRWLGSRLQGSKL
ncbi:MAG: DoxX family protein [Gammaproteobacteria bacterium]|nr:DoxX family protein [Gammaproteobacteria bacterium]